METGTGAATPSEHAASPPPVRFVRTRQVLHRLVPVVVIAIFAIERILVPEPQSAE